MPDIYLASSSPRRQELLRQIGIAFHQLDVSVDEEPGPQETGRELALRLARRKAVAGWAHRQRTLDIPVLGADTVVVCKGKILGKPAGQAQALAMLELLSGSTQQVFSAVSVCQGEKTASAVNLSSVTFREIPRQERESYWYSGEPADKAGAYAIQGLGAVFIEELKGSFSAVMGLPLYETHKLLVQFGIHCLLNRYSNNLENE